MDETKSNRAVTLTEFSAFIAAKAPQKPCGECGADAWRVFADDPADMTGNGPVLKSFHPHASDDDYGRYFYPMRCTNCGLSKFYEVETVEAWVRGGKQQVNADG